MKEIYLLLAWESNDRGDFDLGDIFAFPTKENAEIFQQKKKHAGCDLSLEICKFDPLFEKMEKERQECFEKEYKEYVG